MFNGEDIQPLAAGLPIKESIGPNPVGPDLIFLKFPFERCAFEGMVCEVADGVFDFVAGSGVEGGYVG